MNIYFVFSSLFLVVFVFSCLGVGVKFFIHKMHFMFYFFIPLIPFMFLLIMPFIVFVHSFKILNSDMEQRVNEALKQQTGVSQPTFKLNFFLRVKFSLELALGSISDFPRHLDDFVELISARAEEKFTSLSSVKEVKINADGMLKDPFQTAMFVQKRLQQRFL